MRDLLSHILAAARAARGIAVATVIGANGPDAPRVGDKLLVGEDGTLAGPAAGAPWARLVADGALACLREDRSRLVRHPWPPQSGTGSLEVYVDVLPAPPRLVVCGAGHIALPLARLAATVGFRVVVVDDRPEYARKDRFPDAAEVLARPFAEALQELIIGPGTYVALITRGHSHDAACLRQVIGSDPSYIGMIGSRRRVWAVLSAMRDEGFPVEQLARVHAPIGLPIAAETPEEIALSIVAEMVSARRQGDTWTLSLKEGKHRELFRALRGSR